MPYDPGLVQPMRDEMTVNGFTELRTREDVKSALTSHDGTVLVFVNSVCGCAAGQARPGVLLAAHHAEKKPDMLTTVFAGQDQEATESVRSYFTGFMPSSPSVALLKDGKLTFMMERSFIETRNAPMIAEELIKAFDLHC